MAKHTFLDLNHTGFTSDSRLSGFPVQQNSVSHESSPIYFRYEHFLIIIFIININEWKCKQILITEFKLLG